MVNPTKKTLDFGVCVCVCILMYLYRYTSISPGFHGSLSHSLGPSAVPGEDLSHGAQRLGRRHLAGASVDAMPIAKCRGDGWGVGSTTVVDLWLIYG